MSAHVRTACESPNCGGSCFDCTLAICAVCGGAEASLTTDCCGAALGVHAWPVVNGDEDYTDALGWHRPAANTKRSPRFG